jgi:hypothetical protein
VYAAHRLGFSDLLRLLPDRPPGALDCPRCGGSGWLCPPSPAGRQGVVCEDHCGGLGWLPGPNTAPRAAATGGNVGDDA